MSPGACASCQSPLFLELEPDSDVEESSTSTSSVNNTVLDDVELGCGCHYHWECLLEAYTVTECPNCAKDISSLSPDGKQQVICTVSNEGGVQDGFDILPLAIEEAYLRTYPEERKAHAYLEFCKEGDIDAVINLLQDDESEQNDEENERIDILKYQGSFESNQGTGLHAAIRYNQQEIAWLMLVLGSSLPWSEFPPVVLQAMEKLGLGKDDRSPEPDIRSFKDSQGRTAARLAQEKGGVWSEWIKSGRLSSG